MKAIRRSDSQTSRSSDVSEPDKIIQQLRDTIEKDEGLAALLERSVVAAREVAEAELNADLVRGPGLAAGPR